MAARDQQGNKGKSRRLGFQHGRKQMAFHVVYAQHRHAQRKRQGMRHRTTHHQRANKARACGVSNAFNLAALLPGLCQHLIAERQEFANVIARGQFRHHPAVIRMHIDLTEQCVRQ